MLSVLSFLRSMFPRKYLISILIATLQCELILGILVGNEIPKLKKWGLKVEDKIKDLEFGQYVNDVFQVLEGAEGFSRRLQEEYNREGISGVKVVNKFHQIVPLDIRSKLDELKRIEVRRLTKYSTQLKQQRRKDDEIIHEMKGKLRHLDVRKADTFGPADLKKLINETTMHLEAIDQYRQKAFKDYEMLKHLEFEELLKRLAPEEREKVENHTAELKKYHKRRMPVYVPLSKPHILEVWEAMDQMNREFFNQRAFFQKHDLNGDDRWDEEELKALMLTEVNRIYNASDPNYDPREKEEELNRMWDYTHQNIDTNKDRFVEYREFLTHSRLRDMTDAEFWEVIGNKPEYTPEEYEAYAKEHREEVNKLIDEGKLKLPETDAIVKLKEGENHIDQKNEEDESLPKRKMDIIDLI